MSKIALRSIALGLALIAGSGAFAPSFAATADRGNNGPSNTSPRGTDGPDENALILFGQIGNCDGRIACTQPRQPKKILRHVVNKDGCKVVLIQAADGTVFRQCRDEIVN